MGEDPIRDRCQSPRVLRWLTALGAALLLLLPSTAFARMTGSESALLREMNRVRAAHGLGRLRIDAHLERAARSHSREMLADGVFTHGSFASRMVRFDVRARLAGENLAWGTGVDATPRAIVEAWLQSPEHRRNLLEATFTRVGVGCFVGAFLGNRDAHVVTADFAG
jgi:uncharacterized protein YkwD